MKPNLFIIGAMKSGTGSLYHYLSFHPDIFMSPVKEPMHFSHKASWSKGNGEYLNLFNGATTEKYLGEASSGYSKMPFHQGVANRIYDFNPDSKIIYIVRHPFERIVSQYKFMVKHFGERCKLSEIILDEKRDFLSISHYAYQIKPYLRLFNDVFIGKFDSLAADPDSFCEELLNWLGLADYPSKVTKKAYHVSPKRIEIIDDTRVFGRLASAVKRSPIRNVIPTPVRKKIRQWVPKNFEVDFESDAFIEDINIASKLSTEILEKWIDEFENLTGKSFHEWSFT